MNSLSTWVLLFSSINWLRQDLTSFDHGDPGWILLVAHRGLPSLVALSHVMLTMDFSSSRSPFLENVCSALCHNKDYYLSPLSSWGLFTVRLMLRTILDCQDEKEQVL